MTYARRISGTKRSGRSPSINLPSAVLTEISQAETELRKTSSSDEFAQLLTRDPPRVGLPWKEEDAILRSQMAVGRAHPVMQGRVERGAPGTGTKAAPGRLSARPLR